MAEPDRRKRSRSGRVLDAVIGGAALGTASGAVLGDAITGVGAGLVALTTRTCPRRRAGDLYPAPVVAVRPPLVSASVDGVQNAAVGISLTLEPRRPL